MKVGCRLNVINKYKRLLSRLVTIIFRAWDTLYWMSLNYLPPVQLLIFISANEKFIGHGHILSHRFNICTWLNLNYSWTWLQFIKSSSCIKYLCGVVFIPSSSASTSSSFSSSFSLSFSSSSFSSSSRYSTSSSEPCWVLIYSEH